MTREFEGFMAEHSNYSSLQLRFLQTLRTFLLQRGEVNRKNLVDPPFTQLHPKGARGLFSASDIEDILRFTGRLVA